MAYHSWEDIDAFNFNSTELKTFLKGLSGIKDNVVLQEFHPAGVAWPTPVDTGMRNHDVIQAEFMMDGSASGPAVKCALGTSSTLTYTYDTGVSVSGTFIVSSAEMTTGPDGSNLLNIEFTPSGTIATDFTT